MNQTVTHASNATSIVGTTMYMSSEQLNGITREIDIRTDIWSLGVILVEILTGQTRLPRRRDVLQQAEWGPDLDPLVEENLILTKQRKVK